MKLRAASERRLFILNYNGLPSSMEVHENLLKKTARGTS